MAQDISWLSSEREKVLADIAKFTKQRDYAQANDPSQVQYYNALLSSSTEHLAAIDAEIQKAQGAPPTSSGEIISEQQQARDNNATTQSPPVEQAPLAPSGRVTYVDIERGTDEPVRTLQQTQQATIIDGRVTSASDPNAWNDGTGADTPPPPNAGQATIINGKVTSELDPNAWGSEDTVIPGSAGVGAGSAALPSQTNINDVYNSNKIIPQPNVLDQYASYTYSASVYLMKPETLNEMSKTGKKSIAGSQLLFQTAGAPVGGRNKYFTNDYYIDKIQLKSSIAGKGTGMSHNVQEIQMTVVEPNGITLLRNLDAAVTDFLGGAGNKSKNFSSQIYLLVIRFYGYDANGNLVQAGKNNTSGGGTATPGAAFIEKYYPMQINKINFKVANKLVEYEIVASAAQYQINIGQMRGTIPFNVELSAMTIKEALLGKADVVAPTSTTTTNTNNTARQAPSTVDIRELDPNAPPPAKLEAPSTTPTPEAPPNAAAAPSAKSTVRKGLVEALNQYQQDLVKSGVGPKYADVYSVEFIGSEIEQAKISKLGGEKKSDAMAVPKNAKDQLDKDTQSTDSNTRILSITAGTQIIQCLDEIVRNSSYINNQSMSTTNESTQKEVNNVSSGKGLVWYKISLAATPIKYDPGRNDYAYNIKFIIHPYKINDMVSNYFPPPIFNGVHKEYNYWFTGENTQILSYEQTYNALYTAILSGGPQSPYTSSEQSDTIKINWQTRSNESGQGAAGRTNEAAANAADYLYNPSDLAQANLTIVGDPAWLQQGELFAAPTKANFTPNAFLADGTINFDSQEILFEVFVNTPGDYNLATGLMDPNQQSSSSAGTSNASVLKPGAKRQSYIYKANTITSEFNKGKFTQQITSSALVKYFRDQSIKGSLVDSSRGLSNSLTGLPTSGISPTTSNQNIQNATGMSVSSIGASSRDSAMLSSAFESAYGRYKAGVPSGTVYTAPDGTVIQNNNDLPAPIQPQPAPPAVPPTSSGRIDSNTIADNNSADIYGVDTNAQTMDREA